jgi:hypothetical protein
MNMMRDAAINEAKRRCVELVRPYAVYQHRKTGDCIIRPLKELAPPGWHMVAAVSPDGQPDSGCDGARVTPVFR